MGRKSIPPEEAWSRIAAVTTPLAEESVERRKARGRILARALLATLDLPAADVSAMDGYALPGPLAADAALPIQGTVAAGDAPGFQLAPGAVARIMTGAPVPEGADRVLEIEATVESNEQLRRRPGARETQPGDNIRRQGEIVRQGDPLLPAGALLTPGALSLLAAHGHDQLPVHRAPTVAVLTTGNEVVPPDRTPQPGQLRDSHTDFLLAALGSLGLAGTSLGISPDDPAQLLPLVRQGLASDVLLLCGGISRGEFDFVGKALTDAGCQILFDAVAIQPGQPLTVATHPGGIVFALPGNPASVMASFWLFVRPTLRRLQGSQAGWWDTAFRAELGAPLPAAIGRDRFLAATLLVSQGRLRVVPHPSRGSHDLAAYALGTALVRVRAGATSAGPGGSCEVLSLADHWASTPPPRGA
jgi:molybdopterin molybdotransferase